MNAKTSDENFVYDVALSFAGEDRTYVAQVAQLLREKDIRLFYDEFAIAEAWGADLYTFLDDVYRRKSRFAVVFISKHYAAKPWTTHERQSAQARALNELGSYLLPVRLDDTELPGLRPTVGHVDARRITVEQLVDLIQQKLGSAPGEIVVTPGLARVPRTTEENRQLLTQRPSAWEHMLYAGILLQRRDAIEHKWHEYEVCYVRRRGGYLDMKEAVTVLRGATSEGSAIVSGISQIFDPRAQEAAFGAPGEPGGPARIEHLAGCLISLYEELLDWVANLRGMNAPTQLRKCLDLTAQLVNQPLRQIRGFIDNLVAEMDTVPARLERGEKVEINMTLTLEADEQLVATISREMALICEQP